MVGVEQEDRLNAAGPDRSPVMMPPRPPPGEDEVVIELVGFESTLSAAVAVLLKEPSRPTARSAARPPGCGPGTGTGLSA
jgi:hypothetical protein